MMRNMTNIKNLMDKIVKELDERLGIFDILTFLRNKEIPQTRHTILYYTGSLILLFFGIQVVTGFMLMCYYKPTLEQANESVARIMTELPLGWIIRSVHHWGASFMVIFVVLHMMGIWITKAYRKPREPTWMTGVALLVLSLSFGFTGYLLPWDTLSLAATKVGTDFPRSIPVVGTWITQLLRGGDDVTGDTLSRFFGAHVSMIPLAILAVIGLHLFLIQRHGISYPLDAEHEKKKVKTLPFWPNFIYREAAVWAALFGILITLAVILPPSLGKQADLMAPAPEGIKPEWYFLFIFQTLKLFPADMLIVSGETVSIMLILLGGFLFFLLPVIDSDPMGKKGRIITYSAYAFLAYAFVMTLWSLL